MISLLKNFINRFLFIFGYRISSINKTNDLVKLYKYKDYNEYKDKLEIGKIVIVEGTLDVNFEYRRKNIRSRKIVTASLTQVRDQAREMGLLTNEKRKLLNVQKQE